MKVQELSDKLNLTVWAGERGLDHEVSGCYIGDLLSWVMGRAEQGNAWITVMGNVNAVAVAKLADISCIILCENSTLDAEAKAQADINGIAVLSARDAAFPLALKLARLLGL